MKDAKASDEETRSLALKILDVITRSEATDESICRAVSFVTSELLRAASAKEFNVPRTEMRALLFFGVVGTKPEGVSQTVYAKEIAWALLRAVLPDGPELGLAISRVMEKLAVEGIRQILGDEGLARISAEANAVAATIDFSRQGKTKL